ncbi:hypothetical protein, partial [Pseudohoeflea coraliihabitans]
MAEAASDFYVYVHRRRDNGQLFYVGKGRGRRKSQAFGRTKEWCAVVDAAHGFTAEILKDGLTDEEARQLEAETIAAHEGVVNVRAHDTRPLTLSKMRQPYTLTLEPELVERL